MNLIKIFWKKLSFETFLVGCVKGFLCKYFYVCQKTIILAAYKIFNKYFPVLVKIFIALKCKQVVDVVGEWKLWTALCGRLTRADCAAGCQCAPAARTLHFLGCGKISFPLGLGKAKKKVALALTASVFIPALSRGVVGKGGVSTAGRRASRW